MDAVEALMDIGQHGMRRADCLWMRPAGSRPGGLKLQVQQLV